MVIRSFKNYLNNNIDKVAHFSVSYFLCLVVWLIYPHYITAILGCVISLSVGYWKEKQDSKFDKYDILANCLGILFFVLKVVILHLHGG